MNAECNGNVSSILNRTNMISNEGVAVDRAKVWEYDSHFQGPHYCGVRTFIESGLSLFVCQSVSDPFFIGSEKSHDKLLGFWLS